MPCLPLLFFVLLMGCRAAPKPDADAPPLNFQITGADAGAISAVFGNAPHYDILHRGTDWAEGPLFLEDGSILFSDVPRNHVLRWKPGWKKARVWLRNSGSAPDDYSREPGSNGLLVNHDNELVLCQHGARRVVRYLGPVSLPGSPFRAIATHYGGQRFNSPNDLVQAADGSILFTDPIYGLPGGAESPVREMDYCGVFRLAPDGKVLLLTRELTRPNGIGLSPDERTLYVSNSDPDRMVIMAYPVLDEEFTLGPGRVFHDATELVGTVPGSSDGMAVARNGMLFATTPGGVRVFRPDGTEVAKIVTGTRIANVALSPDEQYLCLASDYYLLRVRLRNLSE